MKRVLLLSTLLVLQFFLKAQKVYFIYLQSESTTPFFVKMAGKILSSNTEGFLVIPKLTDSTYQFTIGQPGKAEEPRFSLTISRGDRGFLIKNIDGTTSLFDLQTLVVYKPLTAEPSAPTVVKNDNFTKLLAKAADDTTLLSQPVVVQESKAKSIEKKKETVAETVAAVQKKDTIQVQPAVVSSDVAVKSAPVAKESLVKMEESNGTGIAKEGTIAIKKEESHDTVQNDYKRSKITKDSEITTSEGLGLVFLEDNYGVMDTIELIIPNPKNILQDAPQQKPVESKQFLEISNDNSTAKKDSTEIKKVESTNVAKQKSLCTALSTDDDFFKLRRDMAAKNTSDEMIAQAKKYFKNKCFRTEQIKYLSTLFLTDEDKYHFFDAAFLHVSDQEKFISLQSEIIDSYYLNRLKALIGN